MNIINIYKIIKKEINFNINNYWIFLSGFVIILTNFIIIYFSEFLSGDHSQTDVRSLTLSIIHLQMYLIPLLSFILSYDSILSEKEAGILDLILSYKISMLDILIGKTLGNSIIFALSFIIGFTPIALYFYFLGIEINVLFNFFLIAIWLSIIFNSFAIYVSNSSKDRTVVILLSILIWLFFIFIYDILFIFLTVMLYGNLSTNFLNLLLLLNPAEIFRIISIYYFMPMDASELFGINIKFLNFTYILIITNIWFVLTISGFILTDKKKV